MQVWNTAAFENYPQNQNYWASTRALGANKPEQSADGNNGDAVFSKKWRIILIVISVLSVAMLLMTIYTTVMSTKRLDQPVSSTTPIGMAI